MDFGSVSRVDSPIGAWVTAHASAPVEHFMAAVSLAHSQVVLWVAAGAIGAYTAWRRELRWTAIALGAIPSGLVLNILLKLLFARARPHLPGVALAYDTYSFPSGHAAGSALVYGVLAAYLAWRFPRRGAPILFFAVASFMVALVCLSRLVLNAHYASDVIAGAAWASIWVAAWVAALAPRAPATAA